MRSADVNEFYHGDCLFVLNHDIEPESIDLIYLDPPFFTGKVQKGKDKWHPEAMEISYNDTKAYWGQHQNRMRQKAPLWLNSIPREDEFKSYIYYMMERLEACKRALKQTGSIYLHCDERASHYLKMVMDEIFGYKNFRNEIVWWYHTGGASKKHFSKKHDIILFYSKKDKYYFDTECIRDQFRETKTDHFNSIDGNGRKCRIRKINNKEYFYYLEDGKIPTDVWEISTINAVAEERTGYPTQKPITLLKRIIQASSNEGGMVLDPFCGCGTTIIAANELGRKWIGIDISKDALNVTKGRESQMTLEQMQGFINSQQVSRDLDEVLAMSPIEFEKWVNQYYKATKPYPDKGVDGITQEGIPIQSKSNEIKSDKLSQFLNEAKYHPKVRQPIKTIIAVSQSGFDDSARKLKFAVEANEGIKVELKTPSEMLKLEG